MKLRYTDYFIIELTCALTGFATIYVKIRFKDTFNSASEMYSPLCCVMLLVYLDGSYCWQDNNGKCRALSTITAVYNTECLIFIGEKKTWDQTKKFCNDRGWIMVEKIDYEKHDIIEKTLYDKFSTDESWIGLRRSDDGEGYKWVSGVTKTKEWPWIDYVPVNEEPPPGTGRCVAVAGAGPDRAGGGWRVRPCHTTLLTICQTEIAQIREQNNSLSIRTSSLSTVMSSTTSTPDTSTPPSLTTVPATTRTTNKTTTKAPLSSSVVTVETSTRESRDKSIVVIHIIVSSALAGGLATVIIGAICYIIKRKGCKQLLGTSK